MRGDGSSFPNAQIASASHRTQPREMQRIMQKGASAVRTAVLARASLPASQVRLPPAPATFAPASPPATSVTCQASGVFHRARGWHATAIRRVRARLARTPRETRPGERAPRRPDTSAGPARSPRAPPPSILCQILPSHPRSLAPLAYAPLFAPLRPAARRPRDGAPRRVARVRRRVP